MGKTGNWEYDELPKPNAQLHARRVRAQKAMLSISPLINSMHDAYCCAMSIELPLVMSHERMWRDAAMQGLTPECIRICIEQRLKFNRGSTCKKGLLIHHLVGSEDDVAVVLNEVAVFKASQRIKVMDPARAEVLRCTHRPDTVPQSDAIHIGSVKLIDDLRKAAQ